MKLKEKYVLYFLVSIMLIHYGFLYKYGSDDMFGVYEVTLGFFAFIITSPGELIAQLIGVKPVSRYNGWVIEYSLIYLVVAGIINMAVYYSVIKVVLWRSGAYNNGTQAETK